MAKGLDTILSFLPRKGHIRLFLGLLIAISGIMLAVAKMHLWADSSSGGRADTAGVVTKPVAPADTAGHSATLDFNAVSRLLSSRSPRLTGNKDTFQTDRGVMVAYYSIDTAMQEAIKRMMKQFNPRYGACAVIDPKSGRILAFVSHQDEGAPDIGDGLYLRNIFPAASIYKTITAAAAIEAAQYSVQTMVPVTGRNHTLYKSQLKKKIAPWKEIPFEDVYAQSINPAFGRIGMYVVGKKTLEEYNIRFGFNSVIPFEMALDTSKVTVPDDTTYAMAELASGFNRHTSITPLHGALIAGAVAEGGVMPCPHLVDSLTDLNGRCFYRAQPMAWKTAISNSTATELRTMMGRVVEAGTARKTFRLLRKCAGPDLLEFGGKTGSIEVDSLGNIEWFIGFGIKKDGPTGHLAVAVVTAHGKLLTVHSSYIGSEIFRNYFCIAKPRVHSVNASRKRHRVHPATAAL